MRDSLAFIFRATVGILVGLVLLPIPVPAHPSVPDGSVIISPRTPPTLSGCATASAPDDSTRIQQAIDAARGTVFFKAGCYYLKHSLRLRSGLTYMGESSFFSFYGSTLVQTALPDPSTGAGVPIFSVDGAVQSITLVGLTFDAISSAKAIAIGAMGASAILQNSTIRGNYFLTELAECIATPMISTRIEHNEFGVNGLPNTQHHRHIYSAYSGPLPAGADNWIVGNAFRSACCVAGPGGGPGSESVFFDSRAQLHITANNFEDNDADTTLDIRGAPQLSVEGNWFENNHGQAQMTLGTQGISAYVEDNRYVMDGYNSDACNLFVLDLEQLPSVSGVAGNLAPTHVSMGFELGGGNCATNAKLVPDKVFAGCQLTITGPFYVQGFGGAQVGGNPNCQ